MMKHICALVICIVISAFICGLIGEMVWPSGPFVGASIWFACVAGIVAPIAYFVIVLAFHDFRTLLRQADRENPKAIRAISFTALAATIIITLGLGTALRLGWLGR